MSKDLKDLSKISDFENIFEFELNEVFTWGNNDREKREIIRQRFTEKFPEKISTENYVWDFKIYFTKNKNSKHGVMWTTSQSLFWILFLKNWLRRITLKWKRLGFTRTIALSM